MIKRVLTKKVPLYFICILLGSLLLACFVHWAINIGYDNSISGLQAENVQDALDEITQDTQDAFDEIASILSCPDDMTDAGAFCIDRDLETTMTWRQAAETCQQEGKRLCSSSEWHSACVEAGGLGINIMPGYHEWVDDLWGNSGAKDVIYSPREIFMGVNGNCQEWSSSYAGIDSKHFRCCKPSL